MKMSELEQQLREQLERTVKAAGPDLAEPIDRAMVLIEPALRLTIMNAVSTAAAEVSSQLSQASVSARLSVGEVELVVEPATADGTHPRRGAPDTSDPAPIREESREISRVTLRLPEDIKEAAEKCAASKGQSLNSWLVQAVRRATHSSCFGTQQQSTLRSSPAGVRGWV